MLRSKRLWAVLAVIVMAFGFWGAMAVSDAFASHRPGHGGRPQPPPCECPPIIELPDGRVCDLVSCGFDCVYVCPFEG